MILRTVESMAAASRNPKYVRHVEVARGRNQIALGVDRITRNSSIDDAIACLEEQIALMRARRFPQQPKEQKP